MIFLFLSCFAFCYFSCMFFYLCLCAVFMEKFSQKIIAFNHSIVLFFFFSFASSHNFTDPFGWNCVTNGTILFLTFWFSCYRKYTYKLIQNNNDQFGKLSSKASNLSEFCLCGHLKSLNTICSTATATLEIHHLSHIVFFSCFSFIYLFWAFGVFFSSYFFSFPLSIHLSVERLAFLLLEKRI